MWLPKLSALCIFLLSLKDSYAEASEERDLDALKGKLALVNEKQCGSSLGNRIIGGKRASLGQFPWMARLGYSRYNNTAVKFRCGATLINSRYVISAAHCTDEKNFITYTLSAIRLGENDAGSDQDCEDKICAPPVQDFKPEKIINHPLTGVPKFRNDLSLIRLDGIAKYNGFVVPICLPLGKAHARSLTDSTAEVAGWGFSNALMRTPSARLLYVSVPLVDIEECVRTYKGDVVVSAPQQLCAGGVVGQDSCGGDSGGPLMKVQAIDGPPRYYLIGVTSFGVTRCGKQGSPAVYTNVHEYGNWILDTVEK